MPPLSRDLAATSGPTAGRTAVVLAAGNGSRLGGLVAAKPLLRVLGMPLIERTLLGLAAAGVDRFVVVLGHRADEVEAGVRARRRLRGCAIEFVRAPDWERGNGASLVAGARAAAGPFILAMADHVFDPAIVGRLLDAATARPDDVHLATDPDAARVFDLDDATKVRSRDGAIVAIGKQLADYDQIDVGLFACPAWVSDEATRALAAGEASVSAVMDRAIARGAMRACPIDGALWQDVDTPAMAREAGARLLASTRKATDGPVSRVLNRPLSIATTRVLARWQVAPNLMTTVVFALGLIAALLMTSTRHELLIGAAVLTQLASVLDGCDGELARVNLRTTRFGAWYDTITDNVRYAAMVTACGIGLYRRDGEVAYLVAAGLFVVGAIYVVAYMTRYLRRHGAAGTHLVIVKQIEERQHQLARNPLFRVLLAARPLAKQDVLALLAALALAAGLPHLVLGGGLIAVLSMILLVRGAIGPQGRAATRWWFGVAGIAALVYLLAQVPPAQVGAALASMGYGWLLAFPIALTWTAANAHGVHALLDRQVGWLAVFANKLVGDGWGALLPLGGVGGDPVRVGMLAYHVPTARALRVVVWDRLINMVSGLVFSVVALAFALDRLDLPAAVRGAAWGYAALAVAAAVLLSAIVLGGAAGGVTARVAAWLGGDRAARAEPAPRLALARFTAVLGWNLLGRAVGLAEIALYLWLLGQPVDPAVVALLGALLAGVATIAFMVPQGIGVAEGSATYGLTLVGAATPIGLAFGLARRGRILLLAGFGLALHAAHARWRGGVRVSPS